MSHTSIISGTAIALLVLAGCASDGADDEMAQLVKRISTQEEQIVAQDALIAEQEQTIEELRARPGGGPSPGAPFTTDGLTDQLYTYFLDDLPEDFEPGPTLWRNQKVPAAFGTDGRRFDSPGAVMVALASVVGDTKGLGSESWEIALRVVSGERDDRARGAMLTWGFQDDSTAGTDVRVDLRRKGAGWYVFAVESRDWCWRAASHDLCV